VTKTPRSIVEQVALLRERGLPLAGPDEHRATRLLVDHNYYRLSGYWRYFQEAPHLGDNRFTATAALDEIEAVYEFDAILRSILLEGLAQFEVTFRSRFAYYLAMEQGPCTYELDTTYRSENVSRRDGTNEDLAKAVTRDIAKDLDRSREDYVKHHRDHALPIPVWVAVEALSFGTVSKMYRLLADDDVRYRVSRTFGLPNPDFLDSTAHSFVVLRNICAHHGRVWNRRPEVPPKVLNPLKTHGDRSIYHQTPWAWLVMLSHLVDAIRHDDRYSTMLWRHVDASPEFHEGLQHPHRR